MNLREKAHRLIVKEIRRREKAAIRLTAKTGLERDVIDVALRRPNDDEIRDILKKAVEG